MPERARLELRDDVADAARSIADGCRELAKALTAMASLLETAPDTPAGFLSFPPFRIDLVNETLWRDDAHIPLRSKPFQVLRYLAEHPQRLVTHAELIEGIWGKVATSESLLRSHIRRLRQAVGHGVIETVNGRGYRMPHPVARLPSEHGVR